MEPCPTCGRPSDGDECLACALDAALEARYRITGLLGKGGSSHTFSAETPGGESRAIKVLPRIADADSLTRFRGQLELLRGLDHPGLPEVYEVLTLGLRGKMALALVQTLVEGRSLKAALAEGERFDEARARTFLSAMLDVLGYLHGLSPPVLHRDVKPSNIIVRPDGAPVLIDFDTARGTAVDPSLPDGTAVGTAGFVPFEQLAGRPVPASDLYGLGMTMIAALSHRDVLSLPVEAMRVRFEPFVNVSEAMKTVLARMVEGDVALRFPSAAEVERALAHAEPGRVRRPQAPAQPDAAARPVEPQAASAAPVGEARRLRAGALSRDDALVWAVEVTASSSYGGGWAASSVVGPPTVFPRHGDERGAWAPGERSAGEEWLEARFPEGTQARGVRVYETNEPGAVHTVEVDGQVVWRGDARLVSDDSARVLEVGFEPREVSRVRVKLDTSISSSWNEIDAIGLLVERATPRPGPKPTATGRRLGAGELEADATLVWAKAVAASSSYGGGWSPSAVIGPPKVFPRHGDHTGAWAQADASGGEEWIEARFPAGARAHGLRIYETNEPGAVHTVELDGEVAWRGQPHLASDDTALVLELAFPTREVARVRALLDTSVSSSWNEIDAIGLLVERPAPEPSPPRALEARRLLPREVDPADPHHVWAVAARASSSYGAGWKPSAVVGRPRVFPRHGDIQGAWAPAKIGAGQEWLEVEWPAAPPARAVRVFETHLPGAVHALDLDGAEVWRGPKRLISDGRARVLEIPLEPPRSARRGRLLLGTWGASSWNEIDAVALLSTRPVPQPTRWPKRAFWGLALLAGLGLIWWFSGGEAPPPVAKAESGAVSSEHADGWAGTVVGRGARLSRDEVAERPWNNWRWNNWAKKARASSSYGAGWTARAATGAPDVFPVHGDRPGAWASARPLMGVQWLEVDFASAAPPARALLVFETCNPGAIYAITDESNGDTIWSAQPDPRPGQAKVLEVVLEPPRDLERVRLWLDTQATTGWNQIDAVGLVPEEERR